MKIKTYKYEKVEVSETEIFIPQKPYYCFETGIRRSICIVPKFVTWENSRQKKGDVYELNVTCVYLSGECKIENFNIAMHTVEDIFETKDGGFRHKEKSILDMLLNDWGDERTQEQFSADLNEAMRKVTENVVL